MAARHYMLTLNGAVQRLNSVLAAAVASVSPPTKASAVGGDQDIACRQIIFAADPANDNAVYIGTDATVSTTNFGFSLDPTSASAEDKIYVGPFDSGPVKLSDFYVIGTAGQRLGILVIPF